MSTVLLCGAFGQRNPGDDALLSAVARAVVDHDLIVPTVGSTPGTARAVPPTASAVGRTLRHVDAVVVGGGTVFKTLHPSSGRHPLGLLARTAALHAATRARGIPFALVGVGVGELRGRTAQRLSRSIAEHADLLILRDEESASLLREAGVTGPFRVGADPAWSLLAHRVTSPGPDTREAVLVALSHLADRDRPRLVSRLVSMVDHLVRGGSPVHLQPWQGGPHDADARLAVEVRRRLDRPGDVGIVAPPIDLHDAVLTCAGARAVIGLRFHSLVAASAAGTPFLALAHEPKLAALARRLRQLSVPPHAAPGVLEQAVDRLLATTAPDRSLVEREVERARQGMALLRVVLSGGAEDELLDDGCTGLTAGVPW